MSLSRRTFLQQASVISTLSLAGLPYAVRAESANEYWWSAGSDHSDGNGVAGFSDNGNSRLLETGFRGHGLCVSPDDGRIVMMARRPGMRGAELTADQNLTLFDVRPGRQFQGHACFSADGARLFTSEIVDSGDGRIGIRNAHDFSWLGEFSSYGTEPHEIKMMPDGVTLAIANGGLTPSADDGRTADKNALVQSSLVFIDSRDGRLIHKYSLPENKASIRHLDIAPDGTLVIALQVQRQWLDDTEPRALVAIRRPDEPLQLLEAPGNLWLALRDYMGSVVIHPDYGVAGVTSPRGNLVVFWELSQGKLLGYFPLHDVCGIALSQQHDCFVVTNSAGDMRFIDPVSLKELKPLRRHSDTVRWDNHLLGPLPVSV